jgi:transposase
MQVLYGRCCGIDVHKKSVTACVLVTGADGQVTAVVRTFGTMTDTLRQLSAWLHAQQVACIALESTGVYWQPVFNVLEEEGHSVVLVNPQHLARVPGRKTDIADSRWLADLLRHGLLKASFIPPADIRVLRDLTRYRRTLVGERAQEVNRVQKVLEGANIKLGDVASDVLGVSGRAMLAAIAAGEEDPAVLAELAQGRLREKLALLRRALEGRVRPHHRVLLRALLDHILFLEDSLEELDAEVQRVLLPFAAQMVLLQSVPGVSRVAAASILAEIGADMSRFVSAAPLASWAGVCPGTKQSGGKRFRSPTTKGNVWLRGVLGQAAWAAIRTKETAFGARFRRVARRQGKQKAVVAVMHHLLVVIYIMLRDQTPYREAGADYYSPQDTQHRVTHHLQQLEHLGYTVTLTPKEDAA